MKKLLLAAVLGLMAMPVMAEQASAHGCHRDVERDRFGWHRHGRDCHRVDVGPPGGWDGRRGDRWEGHRPPPPRCVERCQYIGPFKDCKRVCD